MLPLTNRIESRKRRRGSDGNSGRLPKRGKYACTACRRSKSKCDGESPCRRCQLNGISCVFAKTGSENLTAALVSLERISRFEEQYVAMQSNMTAMVSSLNQILSILQTRGGASFIPSNVAPTTMEHNLHRERVQTFPPLPGFAPPPRIYGSYGIVPSTTPSDDEDGIPLPSLALNAPIEALQGLANAALARSELTTSRKSTQAKPAPAFPHVVEKGLVTDSEARELYHIFFAGCHLFIPVFDPTYDTYESLMARTPWTFDAILAIASKIRSGSGPMTPTFHACLAEAQGIARSSLFGPVVRKEAVQGMLLLAAWSTNAWLPSGHAVHMALDLGLHHALEKLANTSKTRSKDEERDLVISARIWLCVYWFSHQMNLRTGRPVVLRQENLIRHCRILLSHPMVSPTDLRLVAQVELISQKTEIYETLAPLKGRINDNTLAFIKEANVGLDDWFQDFDGLHHLIKDEHSLLRNFLAGELHFTKLWLVCVALMGVNCSTMSFQQREVAFQAKEAAMDFIQIFLTRECRAALRYAAHDTLMITAFSGVFLLKMVNLFPAELDAFAITSEVITLVEHLSSIAAERYALPLRIMLAYLRRKADVRDSILPPILTSLPTSYEKIAVKQSDLNFFVTPAFTMEELGFLPPRSGSVIAHSSVPTWLQEKSLTDLGLPANGLDGIFIEVRGADGWTGDFLATPDAW
ncbi:hypothetical protein CPB85DRAFT_535870 [Mucidula mucida]|nr:hypothetical protein CPB85DRAFT_535870 [Mucidula mucida]